MAAPYDVIIVGARCAGASSAMLLARKGYRVLLVDRATFPSDTLSTLAIQPRGVAALARWGLLEEVVASGCPAITNCSFDFGPVTIAGVATAGRRRRDRLRAPAHRARHDPGARRGRGRRRGARGLQPRQVLVEEGRVVGVRGRPANGQSVDERARVVIGADGRNSAVARGRERRALPREAAPGAALLHLLQRPAGRRDRDGGAPGPCLGAHPHQRRADAAGGRVADGRGRRLPGRRRGQLPGDVRAAASVRRPGPRRDAGGALHAAAPPRTSSGCRTAPAGRWSATRVTRRPDRAARHQRRLPRRRAVPARWTRRSAARRRSMPPWPATRRPATPRPCRCTSSPRRWPRSPRHRRVPAPGRDAGNPAAMDVFAGVSPAPCHPPSSSARPTSAGSCPRWAEPRPVGHQPNLLRIPRR